MKNKLLLLTAFVFIHSINTNACNICGGSSGGSYFGILPQFYKNFISVRYTYKSFAYNNFQSSTLGNGKVNKEDYNTIELWGRFYVKKRLQVFFFIPYSVNTRYEEQRNVQIQSIGDISFFANYTVLNRTADSLKLKHMLLIGGGVKLPTGKYQQRDVNKTLFPISFQIGTGSYALQSNFIYTIRYKKIGLNTDVNYKINFENELYYKLGNQLNCSSMFFFWQKASNVILLPQTGIFLEDFNKDSEFGVSKKQTGGKNLFYNLGIDIYYKKMIVGAMLLNPIVSNVANTLPVAKTRLLVNVSYLF